jgi:hypothetical protein
MFFFFKEVKIREAEGGRGMVSSAFIDLLRYAVLMMVV